MAGKEHYPVLCMESEMVLVHCGLQRSQHQHSDHHAECQQCGTQGAGAQENVLSSQHSQSYEAALKAGEVSGEAP